MKTLYILVTVIILLFTYESIKSFVVKCKDELRRKNDEIHSSK